MMIATSQRAQVIYHVRSIERGPSKKFFKCFLISKFCEGIYMISQTKELKEMLRDNAALRWLPGKSCEDGSWLPTWLHLADTAGVMDRIITEWLPLSSVAATRVDDDVFARVCRFLALTHDIGKMTPLFAARLAGKLPDVKSRLEGYGIASLDITKYDNGSSSPHVRAGREILRSFGCRSNIASIVGAHHGKPQDKTDANKFEFCESRFAINYFGYDKTFQNYRESAEGRTWDAVRKRWCGFALEEAGYRSYDELPELIPPAQLVASGLLIMADWIASNTRYFPLIATDECGLDVDLEARVDAAMKKIKLPDIWSPRRFFVSDEDFADEFGFNVNGIQRALIDEAEKSDEGGIFILEAPMGCGKTEAALAAAEVLASKNGSGGIFFGLPTQATANGIFKRISAWARHQSEETEQAIRLAHGMAELNEDYRALFEGDAITNEDGENGGLVAHSWFKGRKQALLADFVIGTIDQLLLGALKQKHVMLRHLGLVGKVVIVDECHAYDAYMNIYLDTAIRWLGAYHVPVIILSATLPSTRRAELIKTYLKSWGDKAKKISDGSWSECRGYPLLTWTDGTEVKQQKIALIGASRSVAIDRISDEAIVDRAREAVDAGGCVGVIANTVARAQDIAKTLREALPDATVKLFHSHFTMHDRAKRERELLSNIGKSSTEQTRRGLVVVGTQVLEQSLDIDFDFLMTDLCPMDLLLQRIGRLHRHEGRERPDALKRARCAVIGATGDELERGSKIIYGEWPLLMTKKLLPDEVALPDDISDLVQDAYADIAGDADLERARRDHDKTVKDKMNKAGTYCLNEPSLKPGKPIDGLLDTDLTDDEKTGRAAVRDGVMSISAIVMVRHDDGTVGFAPWACDGKKVDAHHTPTSDLAREIAAQRMDLPFIFNVGERYGEAVDELENMTKTLPEWQKSSWLDGELILLLNDRHEGELCGYILRYTEEEGLVFEKKENKEN